MIVATYNLTWVLIAINYKLLGLTHVNAILFRVPLAVAHVSIIVLSQINFCNFGVCNYYTYRGRGRKNGLLIPPLSLTLECKRNKKNVAHSLAI